MKMNGVSYVRAIRALMQEKEVAAITFSRCDYPSSATKDQLPWCKALDRFVEIVSMPWDTDEGIVLAVCNSDGSMEQPVFTGVEDEDFALLYQNAYRKLRDVPDPDAETWLSRYLHPVYSDWRVTGESTAERPDILNEWVGVLTNGEDMLFYRVDREHEFRNKCRIFTDLGAFLLGEPYDTISYPWIAENNSLFLRCLNETKPGEDFYQKVAERFDAQIRKRYFGALVAFLKRKQVDVVYFDDSDYYEVEDENCIPWCQEVDRFVERLRLVSDNDKGDRVVISVVDTDNKVVEKEFNGDDKEDWPVLFDEAYNKIWDGGILDDEAEIFYEEYCARLSDEE